MQKDKTICLIGAGNIGSRHLQGLALVKTPLLITVVEPSYEAQHVAQERYTSALKDTRHKVRYTNNMSHLPEKVDIAIVATNSNVRANLVKKLLDSSQVKYLILEKILFDKPQDYAKIAKLLVAKKTKAYVNCAMRTQPFYWNLKSELSNNKITYFVTGSNYGLVTNSIHFVDHLAYLGNSNKFTVDTQFLDKKIIPSKRAGYLELMGELIIKFDNGNMAILSCSQAGTAPIVIEIHSSNLHCISIDSIQKAYIAREGEEWDWHDTSINVPYQSQMTNIVVEELLDQGKCKLATFSFSSQTHLQLFDPLLKFINANSRGKYKAYPFT